MNDAVHDGTSGWRWFWFGVLWVVTGLYLFGAAVHVANMASATGFEWRAAPVKWQVLDVVYLVLNLTVVVGLRWMVSVSILAFYVAAVSQVVLYTVGRGWITNVPAPFQPDAAALAYMDLLVVFHVAAMIAVTGAILVVGRRQANSQTM